MATRPPEGVHGGTDRGSARRVHYPGPHARPLLSAAGCGHSMASNATSETAFLNIRTGPTPDAEILAALVAGRCARAFDVLGMHGLDGEAGPGMVVRVFLPWADRVDLLREGTPIAMERTDEGGIFEAVFAGEENFFPYRLRATDRRNREVELDDPYRFLPVLDEETLLRFRQGTEVRAHRFLGACPVVHQDVAGTRFGVFAPDAANVNLMGDFNGWDARCHPMRPRGSTGVWELFVPGVGQGAHYKYEVHPREGGRVLAKADPYGFAHELRPASASVVWDPDAFEWTDHAWMASRTERQAVDRPMSVYEVHLGSWRRRPGADPKAGEPGWLTYTELADTLLPYVQELGYTHVELLPVTEHPLDESWGYQTTGYFAPTARHGTPDEFKAFVDRAHALGIGVILDWVPAHFPTDPHGLRAFDGLPLYEHPDPRRGAHPDWGTLVFDYGRPEVAEFLVSSALFWLEAYHADGLRVDAVASMLYLDYSRPEGQWVPNAYGGNENLDAIAFLRRLNDEVHGACPGALMIAEESTAWPRVTHPPAEGGLGFDVKWNMGWMNDTLEVFKADPLFRKGLYNKLTFSMIYAFSERFLLPFSHDEVVHLKGSLLSKMPGSAEERFANLRLLLAYMWAHPGRKLLFMGSELGQWAEWSEAGELNWRALEGEQPRGLTELIRRLNQLYTTEPALHEVDTSWEGFEWIDCHDPDRTVISFLRWAREWTHPVAVACSFTPVAWEGFRLAVPYAGRYRVLLNTDAKAFGGAGRGPEGIVTATEGELHGRPAWVEITLPPLGAVYVQPLDAAEVSGGGRSDLEPRAPEPPAPDAGRDRGRSS